MALDNKFIVFLLVAILNNALDAAEPTESTRKVIKKEFPPDEKVNVTPSTVVGVHVYRDKAPNDVIEEKLRPKEKNNSSYPNQFTSNVLTNNQVEVYEPSLKRKNSDDIPESFETGFYLFVALSIAAISLIFIKVYRLRLSRAERKYGVQGDRTTQELTPLPISIEDANSDDDDQTLFELNRQQIRIL